MSSRRPGSGRPQSRFNPITGEETPPPERYVDSRAASRPGSRPDSRPQEVPRLELGRLEDADAHHRPPYQHYDYKLDTPNTASTVSWGTPVPSERENFYYGGAGDSYPQTIQTPRMEAGKHSKRHDEVPVVDVKQKTVPPSSDRLYKEYGKELLEAYNQSHIVQEKVHKHMTKQCNQWPSSESPAVTDHRDTLNKIWTDGDIRSKKFLIKKQNAEDVEEEKKKQKLLDTVMVDQLSRAVISDPDQDQNIPETPPHHLPGMSRGAIRHLHESKVKTTGTATEQLLAQRVRFGARVLTRNGHDAIRELEGFFFAVDNSLTVYEFKQFGKSAKALPFIARGTYRHMHGRRRGQPITLPDIVVGNNLSFSVQGQHSLPDSLKIYPTVTIRVTMVDDSAKEKILMPNVLPSKKDTTWAQLHMPSKEEFRDIRLLREIQDQVRHKLKKRGIRTVTGLGLYFRSVDKTGDGVLDMEELKEALAKFRIEISEEKFYSVWDVLDQNGDGVLDYGEFMRGFIGEMNEYRKGLVRKAFQKLDANKSGVVTLTNMKKFFNANKHPLVKSGEASEAEVLQDFLESFEHCVKSGEVSYVEFEEYYEGLSITIENDEHFSNILRNSWGI